MIPVRCISESSSSNIKVTGPRSTSAIFVNDDRRLYRLVQFDGCVVEHQTACDWIVELPGVGRVAVELKGSDVDHAAAQIECTLLYLRNHNLAKPRLAGLIVCTRYPRVDTKIQRIKQRIARDYGAPMTVTADGRGLVFEEVLSF